MCVGRGEETGFQIEQRNWRRKKMRALQCALDKKSPIQGTRERWAATVPQALWGFGRGGSGGGDGIGAWALSIAAVGERVWAGCGTDSGTRQP